MIDLVEVPLTTPIETRLGLLRTIALEGSREPAVRSLARRLVVELPASAEWWWPLLVAVQRLPVIEDPPETDVYRSALATLAQGGDCANKCALLASLITCAREQFLRASGAQSWLVWEHCGPCLYDHVTLCLSPRPSQCVTLDALYEGLEPGARAVEWAPRALWELRV